MFSPRVSVEQGKNKRGLLPLQEPERLKRQKKPDPEVRLKAEIT